MQRATLLFTATCVLTTSLWATTARAMQDTRTVVEPTRPASCALLPAQLTIVADTTVADADEAHRDTQRIQAAIDKCAKGRAVILRADGGKRAFLSGPLVLRAGVTLVIDSTVTLFASRNPRDY